MKGAVLEGKIVYRRFRLFNRRPLRAGKNLAFRRGPLRLPIDRVKSLHYIAQMLLVYGNGEFFRT